MDITGLLSNTGFIMYNKQIALSRGVLEAILIGELCAYYQMWLEKGALIERDGWFYLTREDIQNDTGLSPKQQRGPLQNLKDDLIIDYKLMGVPAKMFYRINIENLYNLMCQKVTTGRDQKAQQGVTKSHSINKVSKKDSKKDNKKGICENTGFSVQLETALNKWIAYKIELNDPYESEGLNALIAQIKNRLAKSSEQDVIDLIQVCMANNWKGIIWDKLKPTARQNPSTKTGSASSIDMDRLHEMLHRGDP